MPLAFRHIQVSSQSHLSPHSTQNKKCSVLSELFLRQPCISYVPPQQPKYEEWEHGSHQISMVFSLRKHFIKNFIKKLRLLALHSFWLSDILSQKMIISTKIQLTRLLPEFSFSLKDAMDLNPQQALVNFSPDDQKAFCSLPTNTIYRERLLYPILT